MKLITIIDSNGVEHNYNPMYVKDIQVVRSDYNNNWCINIVFTDNATSGGPIHTVLCESEEDARTKADMYICALETIR